MCLYYEGRERKRVEGQQGRMRRARERERTNSFGFILCVYQEYILSTLRVCYVKICGVTIEIDVPEAAWQQVVQEERFAVGL